MDKSQAGETPRKDAGGAREVAAQYNQAWTNLARGLHERSAACHKEHAEAWTAFEKIRQEVQQDSTKRALEAYRDYAKAAQDAMLSEASQQKPKLQEAYQNYVALMQGLQEAGTSKLQEAYKGLAEKLQRASAEVQQQTRQQYANYLGSIKQIWTSWSPDSLV